MAHVLAAKMLIDMLNLLAGEVHDEGQAVEVRQILFESDEGALALETVEKTVGLTVVEVETVFCSTRLAPLEITVTQPPLPPAALMGGT